MQSVILVGDKTFCEEKIRTILKDLSIAPHQIFAYPSKIKISDARAIKQKIGYKTEFHQNRAFILEEPITTEAQNALLKTLEELPDNTYIFFSVRHLDHLLLTIASRSKIIFLKRESVFREEVYSSLSQVFSNSRNNAILLNVLGFLEKNPLLSEQELDELVICARELLLGKIQKQENPWDIYFFLKNIIELYPVLLSNNVNKRFAVETILFSRASSYLEDSVKKLIS